MAFYMPGMGLVPMGHPGGHRHGGRMMMVGGHPGMAMMGSGGPMLLHVGHPGAVMMHGHPGMMLVHGGGGGHHGLVMHHGARPGLLMAPHGQVVQYRHERCGTMMAPRRNAFCDNCGRSADNGVGCSRCNQDICRSCIDDRIRDRDNNNDRHTPARAAVGDSESTTHRYTALGMMQHRGYPVQRETDSNGVTWYRKTWPADMAATCLAGWRRCESIGGVVPDVQYVDSRTLRVKGGTLVARFVKRPPSSSTKARLLASIDALEARLAAAGVAHCDVKPENAVVDEASCRILLIDADFATEFGRQRPAWTPGVNGNGPEVCGPRTDRMGFNTLRAALQ